MVHDYVEHVHACRAKPRVGAENHRHHRAPHRNFTLLGFTITRHGESSARVVILDACPLCMRHETVSCVVLTEVEPRRPRLVLVCMAGPCTAGTMCSLRDSNLEQSRD